MSDESGIQWFSGFGKKCRVFISLASYDTEDSSKGKEDGAFAVSKDGHVVSEGEYEITSDQLVVSDEMGKMACIDPPDIATGTYHYEYNGNGLKLTTVQDHYGGRNLVLTLHPLTR
jgi:hypothetical protein